MKRSSRRAMIAVCALLAVAGTDWYGAASLHASGTCGAMDVVFVIDTTGSMGGAIDNVKAQLGPIMDQIEAASGGDYRLALVTFKDTVNVDEDFAAGNRTSIALKINALVADGGGREPEASDEALNTVINSLNDEDRGVCFAFEAEVPCQTGDFGDFRSSALKIAILVTDAHPGGFNDRFVVGDDDVNAHSRAVEASNKGIKISAVFVPTCVECESRNAEIRTIMQDYASTSGGVFRETNSDGTGTDQAITEIIDACGSGDICNENGSPNGFDEDEDGYPDDGCYVEQDLLFTDDTPRQAKFNELDPETKLGNVRTNYLTLTHQYGVTAPFTLTVRATLKNPADVIFDDDTFNDGVCDPNATTDASPAPCVVYEVIHHEGGSTLVPGNRAVKWAIGYFRPTGEPVTRSPVMGYSAGCGMFDRSILSLFQEPDPVDPEGIGYTDGYGSCVGMGTVPPPAAGDAEACHVDGSPNAIDEDNDGLFDENCSVERSAEFAFGQKRKTFPFKDLGNVKPNLFTLDHLADVNTPFGLSVVATIVDPADILFFGPDFPSDTVCASNSIFTGDPLAKLPCVHYQVVGGANAQGKFNQVADGPDVEWTIQYFAPQSQSLTQLAGMGYTPDCDRRFGRNILDSFDPLSDPVDPEGIGYTDGYGSCVIMTATDAPPPVLDLPDDITVVAESAAGTIVSYTATATGVINGVMTEFNATCTPPSGSLFAIGQHTVSCSATDTEGDTTTDTFNINVIYGVCALYDTVKPKKAGSTIPIKLNLCDASGNNLSSASLVLHATSLTHQSGTTVGDPEDPGNSQPDDNFRFTSPSYHFNLQTTGLGSGQWTLNFTVGGDPTVYSTPFSIK